MIALAIALSTVGCESRADKAKREAALAEAKMYERASIEATDRAARINEKAHVERLKLLIDTESNLRARIALTDGGTGDDAKRLKDLGPKLKAQRRLVEKEREELVALRRETVRAMKRAQPEDTLDGNVLRQRLEGIEEVLNATNAALNPDAAAP